MFDFVVCLNCGSAGTVELGAEICPECGKIGVLRRRTVSCNTMLWE